MKTQKPSIKICSLRLKQHEGVVLVLDVGTSGVKAFMFDGKCRILAKAYRRIKKLRPRRGWVQQDPKDILHASLIVLRKAVRESGVVPSKIRGIGFTNQREATVCWDRRTGSPVYPLIGWEDTRTKGYCSKIEKQSGAWVRNSTGLPVGSYFSASKIHWILDTIPRSRQLVREGQLAFGTLDSWLLWNFCEGRPHLTDETNASRTLLFNIRTRKWDDALLKLFNIPSTILPRVVSSRGHFGVLDKKILGVRIPVLAVCGDQQASAYAAIHAQPVSQKPVTKITFGTGTFIVQTLGSRFSLHPSFFTTLVPGNGGAIFALEMKIEGSGEAVSRVLLRPGKLRACLEKLARNVNLYLRRLPVHPKCLVVDGGIARGGQIAQIQQETSGREVCLQPTYDGTAFGAALLVWDML